MSLTLTTFSSSSAIDATVMRARLASVEAYLNEESVAADRGTEWVAANHIYRPDFYGAPDPHTEMVSGATHFRQTSTDDRERAFFSYYLNTTNYVPVPGLQATFCLPETLTAGTYRYRMMAFASFYVYEYGGYSIKNPGGIDDTSNLVATVRLHVNGTTIASTQRHVYLGSMCASAGAFGGLFYPRKQYGMVYAWAGSADVGVGVNHIGVAVRNYAPNKSSGEYWKHLIFQQRNLTVRYYLR